MRRRIAILLLLSAPALLSARRVLRTSVPQYNSAAINNPSTRPSLTAKSTGPAVLRAQILLDRANFSVGEIDARIGSNTEAALAGFRTSRRLPTGSGVDAAVWQALNEEHAPAVVPYTITAEDAQGPFVKIPPDMMAMAKLEHLGYASLLDELAERFHTAPALLRQLNPTQPFKGAGEKIIVPNVLTDPPPQAAKIVVSKSSKTITAFDQAGRILAQYPSTSGSEHDPLPIGEWKVTGTARNPAFHYNPDLFWDAKPEHTKETIAAGPRNPVGVVWIDLSKEHYGIHGTPDPATVGFAQSHGCIRLTNWDALELASMVKPGTPVSLVE